MCWPGSMSTYSHTQHVFTNHMAMRRCVAVRSIVGRPQTISAMPGRTASSRSCIHPVLQDTQATRSFSLNEGLYFSRVSASSLYLVTRAGAASPADVLRSEERRVGKECR